MTSNGSGRIITFYSYKGGTGRSMALANVAWVLASNGRRVLVVDWDLEAPGLHRYFYPFLVDPELTSSNGIIDLLIDFQCAALPVKEDEKRAADWYKPHADILRYASSLEWQFPGNGTLDFIPSGRQTDSYSTRVTSFNWQFFYDELGGGVFLEAVKDRMREEYDYILIDSRTGVSDTSGICTVQMPDALAVCFTLNHQSIEGAAAVATSVYEQRRRVDPVIEIFPIPMRVDNSEKDKLERRLEYAKKQFERFPAHIPHAKRTDYWGEVEIIYVPYYAYEEILAPFGDKRGQTVSLLGSVERLTEYLTQDDSQGEVSRLVSPPEVERQQVLAAYGRDQFVEDSDEELLKAAEDEHINAAERVYAWFTTEQRVVAKRVFTRLVRVPPPDEVETYSRHRVKKSDLGTEAKPILDELLYHQVALLGQDEASQEKTVELAHDSLAEKWKRLQDWIAEDRDFLLWRQGLQLAVSKWIDTGRHNDAMLHGAFLKEAERYWAARADALSKTECDFIAESVRIDRAADKAHRRRRRLGLVLKVGVAAVLLFVPLVMAYQLIFHRRKTLIYFGFQPPMYDVQWLDDFLLVANKIPNASLWDYPREVPIDNQWVIEKGEGQAPDDGALLVRSKSMGVTNITPKAFYDYTAEFKVQIVKGSKAAWVFRAQPDKQTGYLFVLEKNSETSSLVLQGYLIRTAGILEPLDNSDGHAIPFRGCCRDDDGFRIRAAVEGSEFKFWITVEANIDPNSLPDSSFDDRTDTGVEYFIEPFRDQHAVFAYGYVGLLEPDDDNQMKFEYLRINPIASK